MSDCWCPLPWISADIRNNGDMRVCSHSQQGHDNGLLRKSDGSTYNATVDAVSDARNSDLLKTIRLDMLAGRWNPACKRCQHENQSGLLSRNKNETKLWQDMFTEDMAKNFTATDGSIDDQTSPIMHYGLRLGNKCNIKCRSCGPTESNFWYEDYVELWHTNRYTESFGQVTLERNEQGKLSPDIDHYRWYESPKFWQYVETNARHIRHVHTVGGEPMLIDQQWEFLKRCIDMGISRDMIIEYNSNVVKIPPIAWELWPHFKQVRIGASVDGIGAVNDYIRYPSQWHMIEENLNRIDACDNINFIVWIASTVMTYNIYHLPDMLEWFMRKKYRKFGYTADSPLIYFHPLYGPKHLNARSLPLDVKKAIAKRFTDCIPHLHDLADSLYDDNHPRRDEIKHGVIKHLERWSNFMMHEDLQELMPKFWRFTDTLDRIRGESIQLSLPELYDLIAGTRP